MESILKSLENDYEKSYVEKLKNAWKDIYSFFDESKIKNKNEYFEGVWKINQTPKK